MTKPIAAIALTAAVLWCACNSTGYGPPPLAPPANADLARAWVAAGAQNS